MLTARGWSALGAAVGMALLWVGFGEAELLAVAAFLAAGAGAAVGFALLARSETSVRRSLSPAVVHEGDQVVVRLEVENRGRRPLWNLVVEDEVEDLGAARFEADRLARESRATAKYEIHCRTRGVHRIGPVRVRVGDPLGLAEAGGPVGLPDRLVVYPAVEALEGLPPVRGRDPSHRAAHPHFSPRGGEEFFTLREYRHGDDLRRVHWRSSAKRDELMIRQLENPWQSRALVFLDPRREAYAGSTAFEKAVKGAASVVRHLHSLGFNIELWAGSRAAGGREDGYRGAMELLATVQMERAVDLGATAARVSRETGGGALVMVTGSPDPEVAAAFLRLARDFGRVLLLSVVPRVRPADRPFTYPGTVVVQVTPNERWGPAWAKGVRRTWSTASAG